MPSSVGGSAGLDQSRISHVRSEVEQKRSVGIGVSRPAQQPNEPAAVVAEVEQKRSVGTGVARPAQQPDEPGTARSEATK
jgi:hypothetical protein